MTKTTAARLGFELRVVVSVAGHRSSPRSISRLRRLPETTELLWQLRQAGVDVPLDALSDEECAQALFDLLQTRA